jgi:hypothetical protein
VKRLLTFALLAAAVATSLAAAELTESVQLCLPPAMLQALS